MTDSNAAQTGAAGSAIDPERLAKTVSTAYDAMLEVIAAVEPRVAEATRAELRDQRSSLKLIASENYASPAVLLTMGTWFSDKYAEGTVGHRFYAGCQNVDTVEALAAEHARELFGAPYAYAQPHSGIDANLVAFWSILAHRIESPALEKHAAKNVNELSEEDWESLRKELGNQRMLGMSLDSGGHLTHGFRPNISGKMFHQRSYGTDPETGLLDYDKVRAAAQEFKPLVLIAGYSAYPRRVNFAKMREIADEVGATLMVDMAHFAGLVAGKVFTGEENPVPYAHVTTTTTHKSLRGPRGGLVLATEEYADSVDRGCPMVLGGPAVARDGRQGGGAGRGAAAVVPDLRPEHRRQREVPGRGLPVPRRQARHGRHRQPHRAARRLVLRAHRPPGRVGAAGRRCGDQPQLRPARPERRLVHLRHPVRHPGADHARLRPGRVRPGGRAGGRRTVQHHAEHHQGRGAVQGDVHPGRRGRGPHQGRLRRAAGQAPALPGARAALTHPGGSLRRTVRVRAYLAESLGAFFVVFTFLGTSTAAPAVTALAVASVLAASVWVGAHVSGAHFNPAVSLGAFLRHRLSLADLWSYWAAQLGGAFVAALVGTAAFRPVRHGLDVSEGPAVLPALLGEFVFTFALVYVVLSVAASRTQEHDVFYGVAAGAVVLVGSLASPVSPAPRSTRRSSSR